MPVDDAPGISANKGALDTHAPLPDPNVIVTSLPKAPATKSFDIPHNLDSIIRNPGVARADVAQSAEHPHGSPEGKRDLSVMQQHIEFFDLNKDGVIWPYETFLGFYYIGFNIIFCIAAMFIIHSGFSYPTLDSWIPHPGLPIYLRNIHRCKHGSDTGVYDTEGRYIPQRFEEIFSKYDRDGKGGLSFGDIMKMQKEIANVFDVFGFLASKFEFITLWLLVKDEQGLIRKEDVRRAYDGTLFYHINARREEQKAQRKAEKERIAAEKNKAVAGKKAAKVLKVKGL